MTRKTLLTLLDNCINRGAEIALAHRRGLRLSRWSYAQLASTAFQFARELESYGVVKGDRILFWAENSPEWVIAFFGCLLRGAVVVPLDVDNTSEFVSRVQQQIEAKILLYGDRTEKRRGESVRLRAMPGFPLKELSQRIIPYATEPYPIDNIDEKDLVEIIFTSGTTSEPKGVCLTHRNLLVNLEPLEREIQKYLKWERYVHPIRFLNLLPLSHVFGQFMGIFVPQVLGGEVFFQETLNPSEIIETTQKQRISVIVIVPRLLDSLRSKIERDYAAYGQVEKFHQDLASAEQWHFLKRWWIFRKIHRQFGWKFWAFVSGGATLSSDTEIFWRRLGFVIVQGYGMTETASLISVNHPFKTGRGSIGKALPGREMKLDEGGEILVRGENVSPGYWSGGVRPLTDDEGWLHTGDIGELDPSGNLYFKGRKKDVIVTGAGVNIYPEDLEAALNNQPEIRGSTVIGIEGPYGPEPFAVLILRDAGSDPAAAIQRANETLGPLQQMHRWLVWPEGDFPRTPTHKVRKRDVWEAVKAYGKEAGKYESMGVWESEKTSPHSQTPTPSSSFILDQITRIRGEASIQVDPSANLATDLGLDSLGRIELLSALEDRYQIDIDEAAFTTATTVGDIEKMIREGAQGTVPSYSYPQWTQRFPVSWIRLAFFYLIMLPLTHLMGRIRVIGEERLQNLSEPVLFVANHITMVDAALILSALPARFRHKVAIAMEGEILQDWLHSPEGTGWFTRLRGLIEYALVVSLFNVFPLPQRSGFRRSFTFAGDTIDRGYHVLVFPEGRRTRDGRMNPFMEGTGLLALNLGVPVVPIKIDGLFELKQQRKYFARPGQLSIIFGEPVRFSERTEPAKITQDLQKRVATL
jgi:long-chain acyl-CoA synthetase